jgi:hypothetical protein
MMLKLFYFVIFTPFVVDILHRKPGRTHILVYGKFQQLSRVAFENRLFL